ncbi:MAG: thymidylate kinase [Myxococcales bacterium]|nr:thymidylate kinase [Myxococcales bacterium]
MKLIVLEGVDGAGTTTQALRLATHFGAHLTREPSDGPIGKELRAILRGERGPVDESAVALLFAADRLDHWHREIAPALARGPVVSDRYVMSSLVYQAPVGEAFVTAINGRAPSPHLTILLDVEVAVAEKRRLQRGGPVERYDDRVTQERLTAAYRQAARAGGAVIVDGNRDAESVFADLVPLVQSCLDRP